jgi:nicotinate phosphoribosyltransferase
MRARAEADLARLPDPLKRLEPFDYPVTVAEPLRALAAEIDTKARRT